MAQHLTIQLKQHTPIIHFQGSQAGATLRATELKPKLDRFLIEKFKTNDKYKKWLISGQNHALNYKVRIVSKDTPSADPISKSNAPMYFGDMGDKESKSLVQTSGVVDVIFFSFHPELIEEINKHFPEFIFKTNFGTRQSKGYGSFFPSDLNRIPEISSIFLEIDKNLLNRNAPTVFTFINYYYQLLKSGINYSKDIDKKNQDCRKIPIKYEHGYLKRYVSDYRDYKWEKPWIKSQFIPNSSSNISSYKFVRAFLGLYPSLKFIKTDENCKSEYNFSVEVAHDGGIKRFKSPITFKPIEFRDYWKVYIHIDDIPDELLNQKFYFTRTDNNETRFLHTPDIILNITDLLIQYHKSLNNKLEIFSFSYDNIKKTYSLGTIRIKNS